MRVLILDRSLTVRSKIESLLEKIEFDELDINMFDDATEALEYIRSNKVDLIFSSVETDGIMDSVSFVDFVIRENQQYISRLFIITSHNKNVTLEEIREVGAKKFIKKPILEEHFKHFVVPEIYRILRK